MCELVRGPVRESVRVENTTLSAHSLQSMPVRLFLPLQQHQLRARLALPPPALDVYGLDVQQHLVLASSNGPHDTPGIDKHTRVDDGGKGKG